MRIFRLRFILPVFCLLLFVAIRGQAQIFEWEQYTTEHGLSQNMLMSICQDAKGFIWIGTRNGLNRFDGYHFKTYRFDPFDSLSLSGNEVFHILEDHRGRLWIATNNGLNLFNREKETFHKIRGKNFNKSLAEDGEGNIWQGGGIDELNKVTIPPDDFTGKQARLETIKVQSGTGLVMTPVWDHQGNAFLRGGDHLYRLEQNRETKQYFLSQNFRTITNPELEAFLLETKDHEIAFHNGLEQGLDHKIWLANKQKLVCWDSRKAVLQKFPLPTELIGYQNPRNFWDHFFKCLEDSRGRYWLSGYSGVFCLDSHTGRFIPLLTLEANPESPFYYGATQFIEDQSGLIWASTRGAGLLKYNEHSHRFSQPAPGKGLWKRESVRAICRTSQNQIWVSLATGEFLLLDSLNRPFDQLIASSYTGPSNTAHSIFEDSKRRVWIGSDLGLLRVLDSRNGKMRFTLYPRKDFVIEGRFSSSLKQMAEDQQGNLWITDQEGLVQFNPETGETVKYPFFGKGQEAAGNEFPTVFIDSKNRKWVGTHLGLLLLDENSGTFIRFGSEANNPSSLSQDIVKSIANDPIQPGKYLWIGTAGGGLNRLNVARKTFEKFTEKDGLPDMVIYGILPDKQGNLWLSTNKGLSVMKVRNKTFRNFDQFDGLQELEFNSYAFSKARDGQLLFGGIKGFNAFYPEEMLKSNRHVPRVVFTDFRISNQSVSVHAPGSVLKTAIPYTDRIELPPDVKVFSFEFAALDLVDPLKNQFTCFMEGFDNEWQKLGTNHSVTYTNLSPGTYTFRVKGSNNDGVWNEAGTSVVIVILSPWYATWWAYLSYFVVIGLVLSLIFILVINRNKAKAEARRFEEVSNAKSLFINTVSHELRTPLTSILGFSKIIKKRLEERILPATPMDDKTSKAAAQVMENLTIVISESERLSVLINEVLDLAKIESGKVVWEEKTINLNTLISKAEKAISNLYEQKNLALKLELEPDLPDTTADEDRILQVLINLLSNAWKFTLAGRVTCRVFVWQEHFIKVEVEDTGIGIPEDYQEFIFEKFGQAMSESLTDKPGGTGLGLSICKEIIEHHGGHIQVKSQPGVGSVFSFTLPIR